MWQPLPRIAEGIAIFQFLSLSPDVVDEALRESASPNLKYLVDLEVGDIVYAYEQLGGWFKGYVISSFPPNSPPRTGIFPANHVQIRSYRTSLATVASSELQHGVTGYLSSETPKLSPEHQRMSPLLRSNSALVTKSSLTSSSATNPNRLRPLSLQEKTLGNIQPSAPTIPQLKPYRTASGFMEPLIDIISSVLKEWCSYLPIYLRDCNYELFNQVKGYMSILFKGRRQLLSQTLSLEDLNKLRSELIHTILLCNKLQGLDSIVLHKEKGLPIDEKNSPLTALYKSHVELSGDGDGRQLEDLLVTSPPHSPLGLNSTPVKKILPKVGMESISGLHHLFFDLKAFVASICSTGEYSELHFSLFNRTTAKFISEEFLIVLTSQGMPSDPNRIGRLRTLFSDLSQKDISDQLYLVCRIVRIGRTLLLEKSKDGLELSSSSVDMPSRMNSLSSRSGSEAINYRRPFGCAVLSVSEMFKASNQADALRESVIKIYTPLNDTTFFSLHESIINQTGEYEQSSRAESICVSFRVFQGQAQVLVREHPTLLLGIPITPRLGFPDVVLPGDNRNAMHLTLCSGDFQQGRRATAKNIQVKVEVRSNEGNGVPLNGAICRGSGEANVTQYDSVVIYHSNNPRWDESIKIEVTPDIFKSSHIFFTFRHCSSKEQSGSTLSLGSKEKSTDSSNFAFAFLPLSLDNHHTIVSDGTHSLALYKYDPKIVASTTYLKCCTNTSRPNKLMSFESLDLVKNYTSPSGITPLKDTFVVRTFLCSTRLTHSESLVNLLHWKEALLTRHDMRSILKNFTFIGELEIVKFLQDIFDVLFDLLGAPSSSFQHRDTPVKQSSHQRQPSVSGAGPTLDDLVFAALVFVLNIVSDRRFTNFRPVLDVYIENHFSSSRVSKHLISSMRKLLLDPTNSTQAMGLRSSIKAWEYLFKLIVRSWGIHRAEEKDKAVNTEPPGAAPPSRDDSVDSQNEFKMSLWSLFGDINRLMSLSTPLSVLGTQTIALQHYHAIFHDLITRFPISELAEVAVSFVDSVVNFRKGNLAHHRLRLIYQLIHGVLFDCPESRHILVKAAVGWIEEYLKQPMTDYVDLEQWREMLRLSYLVVTEMLEKIHSTHYKGRGDGYLTSNEIELEDPDVEVMLNILPLLLEVYHRLRQVSMPTTFDHTRAAASKHNSGLSGALSPPSSPDLPPTELFDRGSNILGETASMILTLVSLASTNQLERFFRTCLVDTGSEKGLQVVVLLLDILHSTLSENAFPKHWLNMTVLSLRMTFKALVPLSTVLRQNLETDDQFSEHIVNIWVKFYTVLAFILASKRLKTEALKPQKQSATIYLLQDVTAQGPHLLSVMWQCLETFKPRIDPDQYRHIILTLLGPILDLNLTLHDDLRQRALDILYAILLSEYEIKKDFKHMEVECFDRLEHLVMTETKGDLTTYNLFVQGLTSKIEEEISEVSLNLALVKLVDSLDKFLELLLNVRDLPNEAQYEDERLMGTMKLLKFIKIMNQDEIYIKYVHQLVDMHIQSQNFTEAGVTLKLHVDLLDWTSKNHLEAMASLGLPSQTTFERKELLLTKILNYFNEGQAWEHGIDVCKELTYQYEHVIFDYGKLASILRTRAQLYENILHKERYYSEYFRVGFYGKGFPISVRNKQYIYRGLAWEKISAFCDRIQNKHPSAQLLNSNGAPSEAILNSNGQYLQITAVTPEPNLQLSVFQQSSLAPGPIREYYEANEVNTFSFCRPVKKSATGEMASPRNSTLLGSKLNAGGNKQVTAPGGTDQVNEFLMLWTEKTIFATESKFPSLLRRAEVISIVTKEQSPVENAVAAMESKTKELSHLEKKYQQYVGTDTSKVNSNPLAMALNGAIDAAVNGGVSMYKRAFLTSDFIQQNPETEEMVEKLDQLIDEQSCLEIHNHIAPSEMRPLHENLDTLFRKNFANELTRITAKKPTLGLYQPPIPVDASNSQMTSQTTPLPNTSLSNPHKLTGSTQSLQLDKRDSQLSDLSGFDPALALSSPASQSAENTSPPTRSSNPFTNALKRLSGGSTTTCSSMDGIDIDYQSLTATCSPSLATTSFTNPADLPNLGKKSRWSLKKYRALLERHLATSSPTTTTTESTHS
ncbi:hypothetical protein K493DRAFT_337071 [Basidiobolus meristosporus CBS 931.73]|uniref:Dedicator of cytokinesis protein 1 n=1 Tax=Basidiobolus meristosporus CBS 931.73 TaxID=1314790 RepID=A0A1Y1YDN9_9FUNG|nr:hypothetical protein K493DRAFT_337071 [Basidiobolus meristosporus CBS 931.73]|eukprot:ORX96112.1 hypothetical protein K493DRAFT_337071 [Basidiobolus meristosporus CBS 931.73]